MPEFEPKPSDGPNVWGTALPDGSETVRKGSSLANQPRPPAPTPDSGITAPVPSVPMDEQPPTFSQIGVGDSIDAYQIERSIGMGGMGSVYLARDQQLDRLVALKVLPSDQNTSDESVQRFIREGRAAARLDHPNIARIYCLGHVRGIHYIAFEYIEGETIRQRIERFGPLPLNEVLKLGQQITEAIEHAASRGVIHRDIKPSNILRTPEGMIKLVDMGLARHHERGGEDQGLTQTGVTLGTFDYISPEQARDPRDVDVRSDLYSLGCTLFHMLTGHPPFPDGTMLQKLLHHQEQPAPDVRSFRPEVPASLANLVHKLLQKDRAKRYQTPQDLSKDLQTIARNMAVGTSTTTPRPTSPGAWEKHLIWGIPAVGLALLISGLAWWGQHIETTTWPAENTIGIQAGSRASNPARTVPPPPPEITTNAASTTSTDEPQPPAVPENPRLISIGSEGDLAATIASAPNGSTITLTDNGPYFVPPAFLEGAETRENTTAPARNLTIKADALVRPVVRLRTQAQPLRQDAALLAFRGGKVQLQGLEFQMESDRGDATVTALQLEGTDLSLSGCSFRNRSRGRSSANLRALEFRGNRRLAESEPLPDIRAVSCFFDAGVTAIFSRSPLDLAVRDCLFAPGLPVAWFDHASDKTSGEYQVSIRHCSIQTAASPVFRFARSKVRIVVENSAIGPAAVEPAVLVATDDTANLDWSGRENLYGNVASYLLPLGTARRSSPINSFSEWVDTNDGIRELRSRQTMKSIWGPPDPVALLDRPDPSAAFALAESAREIGARRSPDSLFVTIGNTLAGLVEPRSPEPRATTTETPTDSNSESQESVRPTQTSQATGSNEQPMATSPMIIPAPMEVRSEDATHVPMAVGTADPDPTRGMPPTTNTSRPTSAEPKPPEPVETGSANGPGSTPTEISGPIRAERNAAESPLDPEANSRVREAHSGLELRSILQSPSAAGELRVFLNSPDRLLLSTVSLSTGNQRIIEGQTQGRRSVIEFSASRPYERESTNPVALFNVPSGTSLELVDLDIVLPRDQRPANGRWSIFSLEPGAALKLRRCTLTLEGIPSNANPSATHSSLIRLESGLGAANLSTDVQVEDCVLRAEGDIIEELSGNSANLSFVNSIVSSGGRLLHASPQTMLKRARDLEISLKIRQATVRALGGLVLLEADNFRAGVPRVAIEASDTILSTGKSGLPLLRVQGQADLETLSDRINWEGQRVVYHDIDIYRRDESAKAGESTIGKTRGSWEVAVRDHDDAPYHGDAHFQRPPAPDTLPWDLSPLDLRLAPESPVPLAGPRMDQLPTPPSSMR